MGICWGSEAASIAPISKNNSKNNKPVVKSPNVPATGPRHGGGGAKVSPPEVGQVIKPNLKVFTYQELRSAAKNFRQDSMLGEGGFGRVYKGWIDETTLAPSKAGVGIPVAIKRCNPHSAQGLKEWKAEIEFLGKFAHANLVKLIGYSFEEKELLLVYEYMQKRSLESHLFQTNREPPCWSTRMKIATDAARGLAFLHTTENTVIYRDFKAANILLDENYNAKLADFGLARLGPPVDKSHVTTQAVGTYGYAAPEYINSGHLYVKSDVYGFGVLLLEMLTGQKAFDSTRPTGQTTLVEWFRPMLSEKSKLKRIVDRRMQEYPPQAINELAQLILRCIQNEPKNRPDMSEVLLILERVSTIKMDPKASKARTSKSSSNGHDKRTIRPHSYHPSPIRGGSGGMSPGPQPYRHTYN